MANPGDVSAGTSTSQVTLAAPGQGRRYHLEGLSVKSDDSYTVTVQSPAGANVIRHTMGPNEGWVLPWHVPMPENSAVVIDVSAGTYDINYRAVVR